MPTLSRDLRKTLEHMVAAARTIGEAGATKALRALAVDLRETHATMVPSERALRTQLRAHGRQLGDVRHQNGAQTIDHLKQACAYEHWHRMLFARFLAENELLLDPQYGVAMSLREVQERARNLNHDWLALAADYAQRMLLDVFRPDDPVLQVILPPETRQQLEEKLAQLPAEIFIAEDSLGWVYQFWQKDEKDRVNKSEDKIGADELAPVTQLFTEDYMVLFLLHNTLGAWWTAKRLAEGKDNSLPGYEWAYLRLNDDGSPAAGNFEGWPKAARDLRVLDPCMGSGHFLTFALPILARMRSEEEATPVADAAAAVLRENLYGLELDARCSQIAAFNLALTAWRLVGYHISLPTMNLACSGLGINASEADWVTLAGEDGRARQTMKKLYALFRQAPTLGSLIDPTRFGRELFAADFSEISPLLQKALAAEQPGDEQRELAVAAQGLLASARILADQFNLVVTNVPYLGRGKQDEALAKYSGDAFPDAKTDLATCFVDRCLNFTKGGYVALVTPQNWLFMPSYKRLRERLLKSTKWNFLACLGPRAFETITGEVVNTALIGLTHQSPVSGGCFSGWDLGAFKTPTDKAEALKKVPHVVCSQACQLQNPDSRVVVTSSTAAARLAQYCSSFLGLGTGDYSHYGRAFWEFPCVSPGWAYQQVTVESTCLWGGREQMIAWDHSTNRVRDMSAEEREQIHNQDQSGQQAWGRRGVAVGLMTDLKCTLYTGEKHDKALSAIIPEDEDNLTALWCFCSDPQYNRLVRELDRNVIAANGTLVKVPFDLAYWKALAAERYPSGLPKPHSGDPTQWLFDGHPKAADHPLHVAVARMVGYRWPRQTGSRFPDCPPIDLDGLEKYVVTDGIVCLSSIAGEAPAAERLRSLLSGAYGSEWSAGKLAELIGDATSLEIWLRDKFFQKHCELFRNRPFIWHIWDGRKDGFHALVNYHKLSGPHGEGCRTLERLIYSSLGDWITRQRAEVAGGVDGAEARLAAAQHLRVVLEKILAGEDPYDIFVRWKRIQEQPMGWEPDLNDGVRLNICPWLTAKPYQPSRQDACILRVTPKINYGKDRGKEPARDKEDFPWFAGTADRNNDHHLTLKQKREARERKKR